MAEEEIRSDAIEIRSDPSHLFLGFIAGTVVFGLFTWLFIKALRETLATVSANSGDTTINNFYSMLPSDHGVPVLPVQPSALANHMQLDDGTSLGTKTDTVTLSTTVGRRVFSAPSSGPMWRVKVHVIGPAGSFAALSIDSPASVDGGNSAIVPAGGETTIRIGARQSISAIAVGGAAQVSYVASSEVV